MKNLLFLLPFVLFNCLCIDGLSQTREFNVGVGGGVGQLYNVSPENFNFAEAIVEYRFSESRFALNFSPRIINVPNQIYVNGPKLIFQLPIALRYIFGDKFRFSPYVGPVLSSQSTFGLIDGGLAEYQVFDRFLPFVKAELNWSYANPTIQGSYWMSVGLKYALVY